MVVVVATQGMNGDWYEGSFEPEPRKVQRVVPVTDNYQEGTRPSAMFRSIQSNMKAKKVRPSPSSSIKKLRGKKSSSIQDNKTQIDRGIYRTIYRSSTR